MNGLAKQTYFDKKLKSINKKVTLNEVRHVETIFGGQGEGGGVERGGGRRMYFKGDDGYHFFQFLPQCQIQ